MSFSQKATVFECKFVPSLQIPIPVPNLRIESSNVSDQGFKLTSIFARVRLKQFLRASPIIPVHAKSAPVLRRRASKRIGKGRFSPNSFKNSLRRCAVQFLQKTLSARVRQRWSPCYSVRFLLVSSYIYYRIVKFKA